MKKLLLITLLLALSATIIFAQTPTTIPGKIAYQGKLLENGTPVTGTRTIEFSIPGTGWTETHNNVTIEKGLYSVQLGSISPIPAAAFSSPTVSLEIVVEGTTLSPQVELLSVPYAYNSENAANIGGNPVSTTVPTIGQTLQWDGTAWVPGDAATKAYIDVLINQLYAGGSITVKDIDGNVYKTVLIGDQIWMAENLKTSKYNDGTAIPNVTDNTAWSNLTTGAYCWYNNDAAHENPYGKLYNWYAVNTNNLCPTGWHVPSNAEWATLTDYLTNNGYGYQGSGNDIGKSVATTTGWTTTSNPGEVGNDQASNNSSGFSGVPGGNRSHSSGGFGAIGLYCFWWSSTQYSTNLAWAGCLYYNFSGLSRSAGNNENGFSVRCVKN